MQLHLHVITVSDRCSRGESTDASGPAAVKFLTEHQAIRDAFSLVRATTVVVPDETDKIRDAITTVTDTRRGGHNEKGAADDDACLIITSGGTGFAPRDVTPEAVEPLLEKKAPSIMHATLAFGLTKVSCAWLSRGVAGSVGSALVITLPGSPKAVVESLEAIASSGLVHAIKLLVNPADTHPIEPSKVEANKPCSRAEGGAELDHNKNTNKNKEYTPADRSRKSDFPLVSVATALAAIVDSTPAAPSSHKSTVMQSVGNILADDANAHFAQPPFRASIKDGYAVVASDGVGTFPVAASFCAGADIDTTFVLKPGNICRVNTGGPIPEGADAVIQVEDTELVERTVDGKDEARVKINIAAKKVGQDIRPVGCDVTAGATIVPKGTLLTTSEVALLNSMGRFHVNVVSKPKIAILSTGDELIDVKNKNKQGNVDDDDDGAAPAECGRIYDSNRPMLLKAAEDYASAVIDLGIAKDVHGPTRDALDRGFRTADVIISTGGVSMGEVDWVKKCLIDMDAHVHFGRVAMKPGKPTTFASKNGKLFFALPGNPVSAMVCFYLFVVPCLRKWAGHSEYFLPSTTARVLEAIKPDPERTEYHRCKLRFDASATAGAQLVATSTGIQASHRLLSMAGANGLLIIPPGKEEVPANSRCPVMIVGPIV